MLSLRKKNIFQSPTFCVYPWMHQVVLPTGTVGFCCVAQNGGPLQDQNKKYMKVPQVTLGQAWNSEQQKDIRNKMMRGEQIEACKICYYQESISKDSYRKMHNREWLNKEEKNLHQRVTETQQSSGQLTEGPIYLDLRLGNLCNLKCRMCNGYNSTKIAAETEKLLKSDPEFKVVYSKFLEPVEIKIPKWYEDEEFWAGVKEQVPFLRKVYLTGGEPTLIKKNYEFLKYCIETGHSRHIFLMFNINGTHIPKEFIDLLHHFEFVLLNVSLDGVGLVNNYVRGGSVWSEVDKNMRFLLSHGAAIKIGITPTIQIYNVLSIVDLLYYVEELASFSGRNLDVDFLYVTDPKYLDVRNLPRAVKNLALEKIRQYRKKSWAYVLANLNLANCLKSLEQALSLEPVYPEAMQDFVVYTRSLDRARNEDLAQSLPELHQLLLSEGVLS